MLPRALPRSLRNDRRVSRVGEQFRTFDNLATVKYLRALGWAMIWSGSLILAFLVYQLWGTGLITARAQAQAEASLDGVFDDALAQLEEQGRPVPPSDPAAVDDPILYPAPFAEEGRPIGRLRIEAAGVSEVIMEGVRSDDLKKGPGHMPWTPMPGQPGNAVLSGHRTTYGAPFFDMDLVTPGDEIVVQTAIGFHTYEVTETFVVSPSDVWVTEPRDGAWLTLTTCHPKASARQRLVVVARLIDGPNFAFVESQLAHAAIGSQS